MEDDDCFATLGLPRTVRLEEAVLQAHYHERVREVIDAADGGGEAGRALHRAREVMADPVKRLRHLLELVAPGRSAGAAALSPDLVGWFSEMDAVMRRADGLLGRLEGAGTALGRALLAEEAVRVQQELQEVLGRLTAQWDGELERLPSGPVPPPEEIAAVLGKLRVLQKWKAEAAERLLRLLAAP